MRGSIHFIFNPTAGSAKLDVVLDVARKLQDAGMAVSVSVTTGPNTASVITKNSEADIFVAAGGDGTVREVIDGLVGSQSKLALLPMGTVNLLASEIEQDATAEMLLNNILSGNLLKLHLGQAGDRHFAVITSVGFDADVVAGVSLGLKKRIGKAAYIVAAIKQLVFFQPKNIVLSIDGIEHQCGWVIVSNGRYYGGKFVCAPNARVTSDKLYACLLQVSGRMDILRYAVALIFGRIYRCPSASIIEGKEFKILHPEAAVQADGDIIGQSPMIIRGGSSDGIFLITSRYKDIGTP